MTFSDSANGWAVVGIVFVAVLISEVIAYLIVYSEPDYIRASTKVKELKEKLSRESRKFVPVDKRQVHDRRLASIEGDLKDATSRMNISKSASNTVSAVFFFLLYRAMAQRCSDWVVAKLPFETFGLLQWLLYHGTATEDSRACGFGLIFILATMSLKSNFPRLLGLTPPRTPKFVQQSPATATVAVAK